MNKRQLATESSPNKRRALQPINTQLASPPTTPEKERIFSINVDSSSTKRKLQFSESIYSKAKALFQRGAINTHSDVLVGREAEAEAFSSFVLDTIQNNICLSLYISGPPGTGKTAQVNLSLSTLCKGSDTIVCANGKKARVLRINCMTVAKADNIFHEILCELNGRDQGRKKTFDDFYQFLCTSHQHVDSVIILLDEMDCLITKDQQVLFQLFQCASTVKSSALATKLGLIGISNALDLTDKFLPRLRINGYTPQPLQFLPYSGEQIKKVIVAKLQSLTLDNKENSPAGARGPSSIPIMHPVAIQLCCKKCAAVTGDLRKAFDICYKSIDFVEHQVRKLNNNDILTVHNAPKVLISHVAQVCASAFGDTSSSKLTKLNFLQKAVLCCLFNMTRSSNINPSVNHLYDYYTKHTDRVAGETMGKLKKGEFLEIISALESACVVVLSKPASSSLDGHIDVGNNVIKTSISEEDATKSVDQVGVLKRLLLQ